MWTALTSGFVAHAARSATVGSMRSGNGETGPGAAAGRQLETRSTSRTKAQMESGDTIANIRSEVALAGLGGPKAMVVLYEGTTPDGYCGVTSGALILMPMARCSIYPESSGVAVRRELPARQRADASPRCGAVLRAALPRGPRRRLSEGRALGGLLDRNWAHLELDTNHDDYYLAGIGGCTDVGSAPYFDAGG